MMRVYAGAIAMRSRGAQCSAGAESAL